MIGAGRRLRRQVPGVAGKRVGVFGCGYDAPWARPVLGEVQRAVLVDVALADDLLHHPRVQAIEGRLPEALVALPSASLDVAVIESVLEHLAEPQHLLAETRRLLAPNGVALISASSWRGKKLIELAAFRLRLTSIARIDDRKRYYDVKDLWPLLVAAGFRPSRIRCFSESLGMITCAVCTAEG
jgi:SAM-dependent methyltransferase